MGDCCLLFFLLLLPNPGGAGLRSWPPAIGGLAACGISLRPGPLAASRPSQLLSVGQTKRQHPLRPMSPAASRPSQLLRTCRQTLPRSCVLPRSLSDLRKYSVYVPPARPCLSHESAWSQRRLPRQPPMRPLLHFCAMPSGACPPAAGCRLSA